MVQRGNGGNSACVNQVSIVIDYADCDFDGPDFFARNYAQRLCVDCSRLPQTSLDNSYCFDSLCRGTEVSSRQFQQRAENTGRAYRPDSNAGDAMGENSISKRKNPSVGRSWYGVTTSHVVVATTLQTGR
jgi:hypothetical protein